MSAVGGKAVIRLKPSLMGGPTLGQTIYYNGRNTATIRFLQPKGQKAPIILHLTIPAPAMCACLSNFTRTKLVRDRLCSDALPAKIVQNEDEPVAIWAKVSTSKAGLGNL